jgi:hypothetical protein
MNFFVLHKFRAGETIDAVIKLHGRHDFTPQELEVLHERYNELNGQKVPTPGETCKVPIEDPPVIR